MTDAALDDLCETLRERVLCDVYGNRDPAPIEAADAIVALRAERDALRGLLLRWLQIVNRARKDAASVAEWDQLRQDSHAAIAQERKA